MRDYLWWNVYVDDMDNPLFIEDVEMPLPFFNQFGGWHAFGRGAWSIMWWVIFLFIVSAYGAMGVGFVLEDNGWGVLIGFGLFWISIEWIIPSIAYALYPRWLRGHHYRLVARVWARQLEQAHDLFMQRANEYLMDSMRGIVFSEKAAGFQVKDHNYFNALLTHISRYRQP